MTKRNPEMDERAVAMDHRAGYLAYQVISWLLLADMALRSWRPAWTMWNGMSVDIIVLLMAGGATYTLTNARAAAYGPRRVRAMGLAILVAAVAAALVALALGAWR